MAGWKLYSISLKDETVKGNLALKSNMVDAG